MKLKTLTYWKVQSSDSDCYSLRAKSKKEAIAKYHEAIKEGCRYHAEVIKIESYYYDMFDLLDSCLSEARGYEKKIKTYKIN